jgi:hypothetical protein
VSLLDVDANALRRIEGITADGLRAMGEIRERGKELDKAADEMFAQRERQRQELDEQVKQAAAKKTEEKPAEEARPKPKRTLALGGDEFRQAREARQADPQKPMPPQQRPGPPPQRPAGPQQPVPPPEPKDEPKPEPVRPGRTMKLGARDEEEAPAQPRDHGQEPRPKPEERPARRPRPPRPEGDDDMSGRTWLR